MLLTRSSSDVLARVLEESLQTRIELGNSNYELHSELHLIIHEIGFQQQAEEEDFKEKVVYYTHRMRSTLEQSKQQFKKITEEYLVLRHNARVAKEVLVRGQNDASQARRELQSCLDTIILEAAAQREKMERNAQSELKYLTDDLRAEVIRKERELETRTVLVKHLVQSQRKEVSELKKECKMYTRKHNKLQETRRSELRLINGELKKLRCMIAEVETKMSSVGEEAQIDFLDIPLGNVEGDQLLLKLRSKLRELQVA
ncbi:hypothetical protein B484DRAFT_444220 [Ochromonadaceae sp. CCMP2298]|nr:hypothetical protein B484DRAFT_444220 [Ochromonadaceae sp. CCMP2298]